MSTVVLRLLCIVCICFSGGAFAQIKFRVPVTGVQGVDYFIGYHTDHDTSSGMSDYHCGAYTYNNHTGTDFMIRSFKHMDSGAYVLAAADGIVIATKDSLFDRNKNMTVAGFGNYILIYHGDSTIAYYAHLKKYSLRVKYLDSVHAGDTIAEVGASGFVTDPHLHFDVYRNSTPIDPFDGPCWNKGAGWISAPAYDTVHRVIDHGFMEGIGTLDTFKERPEFRYFYSRNDDSIITFWIHQTRMKKGDSLQIEWQDLQNAITLYTWHYTYDQSFAYSYYWIYILNPAFFDAPGVYRIVYKVNGVPRLSDYFEAINVPTGSSRGLISLPIEVYADRERGVLHAQSIPGIYDTEVTVLDITGRIVAKPDLKEMSAGGWNYSSSLNPGVYFVNIRAGFQIKKIKLLL